MENSKKRVHDFWNEASCRESLYLQGSDQRAYEARPTWYEIYSQYLESPGTKAYSVAEARQVFSAFSHVTIRIVHSHGICWNHRPGSVTTVRCFR